jgi:hypothetical protein
MTVYKDPWLGVLTQEGLLLGIKAVWNDFCSAAPLKKRPQPACASSGNTQATDQTIEIGFYLGGSLLPFIRYMSRVGQNHIYTVFIGIFGWEITEHTVIYGVYIRVRPTLYMSWFLTA